MSSRALADQRAREAALDCERSFIVQAPAGSGKTGLLTRRFLRLLARVERPEEILAITFTRKAAAEMRARIIDALRRAADGNVPDDEFAALIIADAKAALANDRAHDWRLLDVPMRLQIMTVDALNTRLVQAMPLRAQAGAVQVVDEQQQKALYEQAANALLEWLSASGPEQADVAQFFEHLDASVWRWRQQLSEFLQRRDQWLPLVLAAGSQDSATLRAVSESILADMVDSQLERLEHLLALSQRDALLALAGGALQQRQTAGHWQAWHLPESWPTETVAALQCWQTIGRICLTKGPKHSIRRRMTVNEGFPPQRKDEKAQMQSLLDDLADQPEFSECWSEVMQLPEPLYSDAQWQAIMSMQRLLPLAAAELQRLMGAQGVVDYPALAARAINALYDRESGAVTDLALRMDYRLQHILVDEMQDTSAAQYDLLEALVAGWQPDDGHSLFCVGDPMQSIYRFRGADVSRFLRAWQEGIAQIELTPLTLTTNFRSDAKIVDWVNATFSTVMGARSDPLMDRVAYSASVPRPGAPQSGKVEWHIGDGDQAPDAAAIADLVAGLLAEYPGDSIALLGRSRASLEPVLAALQSASIGCEAVEMQRLTERPEILDLLALTRALDHSGDRVAWLGLARSPFMALSAEQIDQLLFSAESSDDTLVERLQEAIGAGLLDAHTEALVARFLAVYQDSVRQAPRKGLRERVEHAWCALGGPGLLSDANQLDNVWQFLDVLETLQVAGQLDRPGHLEQQLDDRRVSRFDATASVSAMTIFKSKGLEFDHVILPALERGAARNAMPPVFLEMVEQDKEAALLFSMETDHKTSEPDPLHRLLAARETQRGINELDRLLYVAATRARKSLHLIAAARVSASGARLAPKQQTLLQRLWPAAAREFSALGDPEPPVPAAEARADRQWIKPQRRQLDRLWQPPERDLPLPVDEAGAPDSGVQPVSFRWAGDQARDIGIVVHHWLQQLAGRPDPAAALDAVTDIDVRIRRMLAVEGVAQAALDETAARVLDALNNGVRCETGHWLLANAHPHSAAELSLGTRIAGERRQLVVDRVIRDESGAVWVVDYKTSLHEGGDLDAFFDNELRRYEQQLDTYAQAVRHYFEACQREIATLHRALYFPHYGVLRRYP